MNQSQILRILPAILFFTLLAYLLLQIILEQAYDWHYYFAIVALGIFAILTLWFLYALFFMRKRKGSNSSTGTISPIWYGLIMGIGVGLFGIGIWDKMIILFLAPVIGLGYGFVLRKLEQR